MDSSNSVTIFSDENFNAFNRTVFRRNLIGKSDEEVCAKSVEITSQTSIQNWQLVCFEELPHWMRDNDYLRSSYRPHLPSYEVCFWSIFRVHNQTTNIWTHLLAALLFKYISLNQFPDYLRSSEDNVIFTIVYSGVILSFYGSTIFHTFLCHSQNTAEIVAKMDYCGVSLHIYANIVGLCYFTYYCDYTKLLYFMIFSTTLCIICLFINCHPIFNKSTSVCRIFRSLIFFAFGFISIVPQMSWFYMNNMRITNSIQYLILMNFCYVFGVILYATRIPERFFIGKCDLIHSHMWFHIFIVGGSYYCYKAINEIAFFRSKSMLC